MTWLINTLWVLYDLGKLGLMFAAYNEYTKLKAKENGYTNRNSR